MGYTSYSFSRPVRVELLERLGTVSQIRSRLPRVLLDMVALPLYQVLGNTGSLACAKDELDFKLGLGGCLGGCLDGCLDVCLDGYGPASAAESDSILLLSWGGRHGRRCCDLDTSLLRHLC